VDRSFEQATPRLENLQGREVLPAAILKPLPPQRQLPRPLSPSGAGTIIDDEADNLLVTSPLFGETARSDRSLEKGRLVHRMLQMLPDIPALERPDAAERYASRAARFWPEPERRRLVDSVLKLLAEPSLEPVFTAHAQSEVSIMGTLELDGRQYAVSGRVDRLAVLADRVVILDYKTNRVPPETEDDVPYAHKAQLAIYREILKPLYPGKVIECVLVYTENATVHSLTERTLQLTLAGLKTK
jgi:ATP-dependent helicase/nuclease subunit A